MIIAIAAGNVQGYLHLRLLVFIASSKYIELKFNHDHWRAVPIESGATIADLFLQRSSRDLVYSCFDKGCPTKALKRTRQCRLVLWVVSVRLYLIEV